MDASFPDALADARELVRLLHVRSYAEMGQAADEDRARLADLETRFATRTAPQADARLESPGREAAFAFAQAFRLSELYPATVGAGDDLLATLSVPTFRCARPAPTDPARHASTFRGLCQRIGLDAADRAAIDVEADGAARKLARRHALVALLRQQLCPDPNRALTPADAHRFFVQPLLAPVVAELAADMIEYQARAQCRAAGLELPSSSVFAHHPAKLDFAWADLLLFFNALKRVNTLYEKDHAQRASFMARARLLFGLKYRRNYPAVRSAEALDAEIDRVLERLLAIFHEVQEADLGTTLETENTFSRAFLNLLRVGTTLNGIVHGQMEGARPYLAPYYQTLVMFIVKFFERDPVQGFWTLAETLAAHAVPLFEAPAAADAHAQDHL